MHQSFPEKCWPINESKKCRSINESKSVSESDRHSAVNGQQV